MLLVMMSKRLVLAVAALVLGGWNLAAGAAMADPPAPPSPPPPAQPGSPPPAQPKTVIDHDGNFAIGTDIVPGVYSSAGPAGNGTCYWKRLGSGDGNTIIDNAMSKKPQVVQIEPTDKAFKTDGCQPWQKTDSATPEPGKSPEAAKTQLDILNALLNPHG